MSSGFGKLVNVPGHESRRKKLHLVENACVKTIKCTYVPFLLSLPHPHVPPYPSRSSQNTRLGSLCYPATSHHHPLTDSSVYVDATFSLCPIHSLSHCVYKSVLSICISGGIGYMFSYGWFMLLYHRNKHKIVKIRKKIQLSNVNEMMIWHHLPFTTIVVV